MSTEWSSGAERSPFHLNPVIARTTGTAVSAETTSMLSMASSGLGFFQVISLGPWLVQPRRDELKGE